MSRRGFILIEDFDLSYRFTDALWDVLPPDALAGIRPLDYQSCNDLRQIELQFRNKGPYNLVKSAYSVVSTRDLSGEGTSDETDDSRWFSDVLPQDATDVYVSWFNSTRSLVALVKREVFAQFWSSFFYPFDVVNVFDDTGEWACLLGPEEGALYCVANAEQHLEQADLDDTILTAYNAPRRPQQ